MSLHALKEYIRYRLKAKTRHSVHSPFVYALTDKILRNKSNIPLSERLNKYLGMQMISAGDDPGVWEDMLNNLPDKNSLMLVPGIHRTVLHSQTWKALQKSRKVTLSIDLYQTGLLFFKEEFKEKQHFILKAASAK